jgi:DNA-binding response OmpR family regulator
MATGSEAAKPSPKPDLLARANDTDGIRVLFVEDDDLCREAVAAALSEHGFAVQSFADGAALLASLEAAAGAEVIVLDWSLPQTSGITCCPSCAGAASTCRSYF